MLYPDINAFFIGNVCFVGAVPGQNCDNRQTLPHKHMRSFLGESCVFRTAMARTYDADSPVVWIQSTFCEQERRNINGGAQPARKSIIEKRDEIEPLPLPIIELQLCRMVRFIYSPSLRYVKTRCFQQDTLRSTVIIAILQRMICWVNLVFQDANGAPLRCTRSQLMSRCPACGTSSVMSPKQCSFASVHRCSFAPPCPSPTAAFLFYK